MEEKKLELFSFSNVIKEVHESGKLVPDLMKCENGNNFRAVSEKAILDVLDPILEKHELYYTINVYDSKLEIREAYGAKGKKLQFIATVRVCIEFFSGDPTKLLPMVKTESVGMGIDDNDKAMGKAYTYAIKYALLKLFRLRYGDDSDFEASKPLITEFRGEKKEDEPKEWAKKKPAKKPSKTGSALMTESQRDYILGMMKDKKVEASQVIEEFDVNPVKDKEIPMDVARDIIKWLKDEEFMPF